MLPAQQVVGKIETAKHIKACARDANRCDGMVVHFNDCRAWCLEHWLHQP